VLGHSIYDMIQSLYPPQSAEKNGIRSNIGDLGSIRQYVPTVSRLLPVGPDLALERLKS
jgi:hypothetical protein